MGQPTPVLFVLGIRGEMQWLEGCYAQVHMDSVGRVDIWQSPSIDNAFAGGPSSITRAVDGDEYSRSLLFGAFVHDFPVHLMLSK